MWVRSGLLFSTLSPNPQPPVVSSSSVWRSPTRCTQGSRSSGFHWLLDRGARKLPNYVNENANNFPRDYRCRLQLSVILLAAQHNKPTPASWNTYVRYVDTNRRVLLLAQPKVSRRHSARKETHDPATMWAGSTGQKEEKVGVGKSEI